MPRKKSTPEKDEAPGFEDAIHRLEEIVSALEEESLPLEAMVDRFEQGTQLLKRCEEILSTARKRLNTIASRDAGDSSDDDDGKPLTTDASDTTDAPDDDDEIRLF